jgi:hypothetical protein
MFVPISLGADPEVFLKKERRYPPSFKAKKIGGKSKPGDWGGGFYYRDGWAVELAPLPSSCREILLYRLFRGLQEVKQVSGFNLSTKPVIPISLKQLEGDHVPADMLAFGCDPAFDAYEDGAQIDPGVEALKHPFRYAGGHIHLGIGSIKNKLLAFLFFIPLILGFLISFFTPLLQYFRFVYLIPLFALLICCGIEEKYRRAIYLAGFIIFSIVYVFMPQYHRENWRALVGTIKPGQTVYMVYSSSDPVRYYLDQNNNSSKIKDLSALPSAMKEKNILVIPYTADIHGVNYQETLTKYGYKEFMTLTARGLKSEVWQKK